MTCAYLTWHHNEYGPEDLKITLDRSKIKDIVESYDEDGWFDRAGGNVMCELDSLLGYSDEYLLHERDAWNLMDGWGGLHLQVVELK